jgi:hypothetical protein
MRSRRIMRVSVEAERSQVQAMNLPVHNRLMTACDEVPRAESELRLRQANSLPWPLRRRRHPSPVKMWRTQRRRRTGRTATVRPRRRRHGPDGDANAGPLSTGLSVTPLPPAGEPWYAGSTAATSPGDLRPNTAASYERLTRIHVVGRLGAVRLAQLTPRHVERGCQAMLADGLAPSSVARVVQVRSLMLDLAVREGAVMADPVAPLSYRARAAPLSPSCRRARWTASSRLPPVRRTPGCGARWRSPGYASAKHSDSPMTTRSAAGALADLVLEGGPTSPGPNDIIETVAASHGAPADAAAGAVGSPSTEAGQPSAFVPSGTISARATQPARPCTVAR